MSNAFNRERSVFLAALERVAPEDWPGFLDQACAGDAALRAKVEGLLGAHAKMGSFRETPPLSQMETLDLSSAEFDGARIGPYKIRELLGEGGMGRVYAAEQEKPVRRKVALKVIRPGMDSRQVIARFEAERHVLALMDHPHIAKVLDAGTTDDHRLYFVMELVRGVPITEFCDSHSYTTKQRLALFIKVCQAVQHAHQKGIIHRDIKPSNVLVTLHDDTAVPKVIDFGVAKATSSLSTEHSIYTGVAQLIGTPLYMSPEQGEMNAIDVDTRSDVYSLGVLLYELITGVTPFDGETFKKAGFDEIRRIIREIDPPRPSERVSTLAAGARTTVSKHRSVKEDALDRTLRGELDWIVMKCLEKDRNRRYETAAALAADVKRFLDDEEVKACPPSTLYRLRKLARRRKGALISISAIAFAALSAVVSLVGSTGLVWRANQNLRKEVYFQRITVAHHELSKDSLGGALRALEECPEDLRDWEWRYLMRLCKVEPLVLRDSTEVHGVAFRPNGKWIASAGNDGMIKIWDIKTRQIIKQFPAHEEAACSVVFHPSGRYLASAGADRLAKVWDLTTDTPQELFRCPCDAIRKFGAAYTVAFCPPDGSCLVAGCDNEVLVWDWKKNLPDAPKHRFPGLEHHSIPVGSDRDGRLLVACVASQQQQGRMCVWDAQSWQMLKTVRTGRIPGPVSALAITADGRLLASADLSQGAFLWDTTTGRPRYHLPHSGNAFGVAFSPDGRRLASVGDDKKVHIWDTASGREVLALRGHTDTCSCVTFSLDGQLLASASSDRTIRVWDATPLRGDEGQEVLVFNAHERETLRSVAVSPTGNLIVSCGDGMPVLVWDAKTGRVTYPPFPGAPLANFYVAWRPDGRRIALAGTEGRRHWIKVWDPSDGHVDYAIPAGQDSSSAGPYFAVAYSPLDGRYLVTGNLEGLVQVWDAATGDSVRTLGIHPREVRGIVFSTDGKHLVTASRDGTLKLWDATQLDKQQEPRHVLNTRIAGTGLNMAFSPDSQWLATGGLEDTVNLWDVQTGLEIDPPLHGHSGGDIYTVAFSPDGQWIASAGEGSVVKVWDGHTGKLLHSIRGHTGAVIGLVFSTNGYLYSASRDKTVRVWDVAQLETKLDR